MALTYVYFEEESTRDEARRLNFAKLPDLLRQLKLSCRGERSWIEK
jgi:hypothetical protein